VVFFGLVRPGYGVLSSPTQGYWKGVEDLYKYNTDKAKALLEEAGWKPGSDGIRAKDGQRLSLLYVTTNSAATVQTGEVIQGMLKDVGIEMKIEAMTNPASLARYQVGDYDIGRLGEQNADPSIMSAPVHSRNITGGTQGNRSKYSNPEVDAKLDAAEQELDPVKRMTMYGELQQTVMDGAFILGASEQALFFASNKSVQNIAYDSMGRHFLINAWIKK
jgi:peptide/nickel transport system substrate-binding protein